MIFYHCIRYETVSIHLLLTIVNNRFIVIQHVLTKYMLCIRLYAASVIISRTSRNKDISRGLFTCALSGISPDNKRLCTCATCITHTCILLLLAMLLLLF